MASDPFLSVLGHTGAGRGSAAVQLVESGKTVAPVSDADMEQIMRQGRDADTVDDTPRSEPEPEEFSDADDGYVPQVDLDGPEDFDDVPPLSYAAGTHDTDEDEENENDDEDETPPLRVPADDNPLNDEYRNRYGDYADEDEDEDEDDEEDDDEPRRKLNIPFDKLNPKNLLDNGKVGKRTVIAGAVALVSALGIGVAFTGSPASNNPPPPAPPAVAGAPADEPEHEIVELRPKSVSAKCPAGSTSATLAWTGSDKDAWVCMRVKGRNAYMDGAILNIDFGRPVVVTSVFNSLGWNDGGGDPNGKSRWNEHMIVNKIVYRLGGTNYYQDIADPSSAGATYNFPGKGVTTSTMSMTIAGSVPPAEIQAKDVDPSAGDTPGGDTVVNSDAEKSTAISTIKIEGFYPPSGSG